MAKTFDVLRHQFVPRHEVLTEKECKEVLARYHIRPEQLPRLLVDDPAAKAIGAQPGDVVRVTRNSLVSGEAIAFRLCVEA